MKDLLLMDLCMQSYIIQSHTHTHTTFITQIRRYTQKFTFSDAFCSALKTIQQVVETQKKYWTALKAAGTNVFFISCFCLSRVTFNIVNFTFIGP